jgi:glutamate 5-kinase
MTARTRLREAKRIVVKVGTSTLTHPSGGMNLHRIEHLVRELIDEANQGKDILLVSSGAIAAGVNTLGLAERPASVPARQALAAIGQGALLHIYEKFFHEYGRTMAQVLLTKENAARHHQYMNSRNALLALLEMNVIPVINENDAVAVDEIKIGDNDNLSAVVAALVDADALIILSDIDGVYTANPRTDAAAKLISEIPEITPDIERIAGGAGSSQGTGGMQTKIEAAKIAQNAGVTMVIARGDADGVIRGILRGEEIGTLFPAREAHLRTRKSWLAFGKHLTGEISVDDGCVAAMRRGASILAVGITAVYGEFSAGETVRVLSPSGREIARGIAAYGAQDVLRLMGHRTVDFRELVADGASEEIIHRDNMVLMI